MFIFISPCLPVHIYFRLLMMLIYNFISLAPRRRTLFDKMSTLKAETLPLTNSRLGGVINASFVGTNHCNYTYFFILFNDSTDSPDFLSLTQSIPINYQYFKVVQTASSIRLELINVCIYLSPLHQEDATQGQFLSGVY